MVEEWERVSIRIISVTLCPDGHILGQFTISFLGRWPAMWIHDLNPSEKIYKNLIEPTPSTPILAHIPAPEERSLETYGTSVHGFQCPEPFSDCGTQHGGFKGI